MWGSLSPRGHTSPLITSAHMAFGLKAANQNGLTDMTGQPSKMAFGKHWSACADAVMDPTMSNL